MNIQLDEIKFALFFSYLFSLIFHGSETKGVRYNLTANMSSMLDLFKNILKQQ